MKPLLSQTWLVQQTKVAPSSRAKVAPQAKARSCPSSGAEGSIEAEVQRDGEKMFKLDLEAYRQKKEEINRGSTQP